MIANMPKNHRPGPLLNAMRTDLYRLDQDRDLETLIAGAEYDDGGLVTSDQKDTWRPAAASLAEALEEQNMAVQNFVVAVRKSTDTVTGTAAKKVAQFKGFPAPFSSSTLNYAEITKYGGIGALDRILAHILNNASMETILPAPRAAA